MRVRYHRVPEETLAELAAGRGGGAGQRLLRGIWLSRHTLLVRGVLEAARTAGDPDTAAWVHAGYEALAGLQERHPAAVRAVICHPSVGAWAGLAVRALLRGIPPPAGAAGPEQMGALAAAAAVRAGADCSVRVPVSGGRLMLPSLGLALPGGGRSSAMVRVTAEGARITSGGARITVPADPHRDAPGWRGLRRVSAVCDGLRLDLLIDDLDPYRMPALGVRDRLTAAETQDWESDLRAAWRLLVRRHPGTAAEIRGLIRVITPLAGPARGRSSASSREVHGTIALSAAGEPRALALTLAHEVQHVKLAMLLDAVALIRPGHQRRYYAPWRDDPRPIYGLLQGAYAHLGVADFWRRERRHQPHDVEPHAEFERWRSATLLACTELLRGDGLTATGTAFVNEMARTLRDWGNEPIPPHAVRLARLRAERHRTLWSRHNGAPAR